MKICCSFYRDFGDFGKAFICEELQGKYKGKQKRITKRDKRKESFFVKLTLLRFEVVKSLRESCSCCCCRNATVEATSSLREDLVLLGVGLAAEGTEAGGGGGGE